MQSHETNVSETASKAAAFGSSKGGVSVFPPFCGVTIQHKLTINSPNDIYEQEADAVADKVMRMTSTDIQTKPLSIAGIQRKCAHCEEEEMTMHRKELNEQETTADDKLESYVGNLSSGGEPLPNGVRNFFEPRFGYNFTNVKVHTDAVAAKSAQSINALAYTSGNNIVFNEGQYSHNTDSGKRLLAHELTHVVQQNANTIERKIQRQANIDEAPPGMSCVLTTGPGHPSGINIIFNQESAVIPPASLSSISGFAGSWNSGGGTDDVFVDGYSSTDGPQSLNWQLSCDRAEAVKTELISNSVASSKIMTLAHGESNEFSRTNLTPNRRVIISSIATPQPPEEEPPVCGSAPAPPVGGPAPLLRNTPIASGADCRGACGADCPSSCTPQPDVVLCVPATSGSCHYTFTYGSVIDCGSHAGCRDHDDCYDSCAAGGETDPFGIGSFCHRGCDIDCISAHSVSECNSWRTGGGPFDSTLRFSDPPVMAGPFPGVCTP